jgi:hypothetical protein
VLVRLAYLAVSNAFTALRLLPLSGREKDIEILWGSFIGFASVRSPMIEG